MSNVGGVGRKITNFITGFIVTDDFTYFNQRVIGLTILMIIITFSFIYFAFLSKNCWVKKKKFENILDKTFQSI